MAELDGVFPISYIHRNVEKFRVIKILPVTSLVTQKSVMQAKNLSQSNRFKYLYPVYYNVSYYICRKERYLPYFKFKKWNESINRLLIIIVAYTAVVELLPKQVIIENTLKIKQY